MAEKKKNAKTIAKILTISVACAVLFAGCLVLLYLKGVPYVFSHPKFINCVEKTVKNMTEADLVIKDMRIETSLSPVIKFRSGLIKLTKNDEKIFVSGGLETDFSFAEIFQRKISLQKAGAVYLFVDANKITKLFPEKQDKKGNDWQVSWFHSLLYINNLKVLYSPVPDINMVINGKNITIADQTEPKYVRFDVDADVTKNKDTIKLHFSDNDSVYIKDRKLNIDNGIIGVNDSKVNINATFDEKTHENNIDIFAKNFDLKNVEAIIGSNMIIANGKEILQYFDNIKGRFDFNVNINNAGLSGKIKLAKSFFRVIPLNNIPITVNEGLIELTPYQITLKDFKGYYGKNSAHTLNMDGQILDYTKTVDTNIMIKGLVANDFTRDYLSPVAGVPLTLTKPTKVFVNVKSLLNKINILWMFKLAKGKDILVDGTSFSPTDLDRVLNGDIYIDGPNLAIKEINYYASPEITRESKNLKPILKISGNLDLAKYGQIKNIGFVIPEPLPSEFLNAFAGQPLFKKGKISGKLQMINTGSYPILDGNMKMEKVLVPSQRLSIREAELKTDKNIIHLEAQGRFKKSQYTFNGQLKNSLLFPIIVRDANLTVDDIDVERILTSFNQQNTETAKTQNIAQANEEDSDEAYVFDTNLVNIEKSTLNVTKGHYKDINFGNVNADMTLDKNGLLKIMSNRFDFAEGISTLRVLCDLKNHDYRVSLGVRNVNSDLIATNLLSLPKEISGKAKGLIILNTDDSLKLNGKIKFEIADGNIGKIGLVQYVMQFASIFRNPLVMISPSTVFDLVNVPDGAFKTIDGELEMKDNVINKIMIKSLAPQLSTFIVGKYDIEKSDAMLRIYTKFGTKKRGIAGFLRNISLNSLANIVPLGSKNVNNYYEAELKMLPPIEAEEKDTQVFLTTVDGDIVNNNFLSSLKKIK